MLLLIYSLHLWGEILACIGISAPTLATISLIVVQKSTITTAKIVLNRVVRPTYAMLCLFLFCFFASCIAF